ncbi:MAG TPA: hypothetical protein PK031_06350, partial [Pseudomonadales bacterium]|nr:hypothetical protein [Pseudomonadales bacterium]
CYGILASHLTQDEEKISRWSSPVSFWLVRDKLLTSMYPNDLRRFEQVKQFCEPAPLFDTPYYDLYNCPWSLVQQALENPAFINDVSVYDDPLF